MKLEQFLPPIRIHTWGGYGSQLYGIYLAIELQRRFPHRRLKILTHTSAIRKMKSEIIHFADFEIMEVDDFSTQDPESRIVEKDLKRIAKVLLRDVIKRFGLISGFLNQCNSTNDLRNLKPWVIEIRGHYTRFIFNEPSLEKLYFLIRKYSRNHTESKSLMCVHYRLGDLIALESKNPISPEKIANCIRKNISYAKDGIEIHSDSPSLAINLLTPLLPQGSKIESQTCDPGQLISRLVDAQVFIGTTAKISVWAAIFRATLLQKTLTMMPEQFSDEFSDHGIGEKITFY